MTQIANSNPDPSHPRTALPPAALLPSPDLVEILTELERYGRPRLGKYDAGWTCSVEMHTVHKGAEFTIRSGFDIKTPTEAAQLCLERARAAAGNGSNP